VPLKDAQTLGGMEELLDYYRLNKDPVNDEITTRRIVEALSVEGAPAWIIRNAVKRNYDKHRKGKRIDPENKIVC